MPATSLRLVAANQMPSKSGMPVLRLWHPRISIKVRESRNPRLYLFQLSINEAPAADTSIARTRNTRKRKNPDTLKPSPSKPPKKKIVRQPKVDPWDYRHLTTSPKSKLVSADLLGLFQNPATWALLTPADIEQLSPHFPEYVPRNEDRTVSIDWLRNNVDWRHSVRQWQKELGGGFYDPEWQKEAQAASAERAAGKFDNNKEDEFEEFWGQKQNPDLSPWTVRSARPAKVIPTLPMQLIEPCRSGTFIWRSAFEEISGRWVLELTYLKPAIQFTLCS